MFPELFQPLLIPLLIIPIAKVATKKKVSDAQCSSQGLHHLVSTDHCPVSPNPVVFLNLFQYNSGDLPAKMFILKVLGHLINPEFILLLYITERRQRCEQSSQGRVIKDQTPSN